MIGNEKQINAVRQPTGKQTEVSRQGDRGYCGYCGNPELPCRFTVVIGNIPAGEAMLLQ